MQNNPGTRENRPGERPDEALLLIGHGSARYPYAGRLLQNQARRIVTTGSFREVEMGLLNGTPSIGEAVARLTAHTIRLVPFFMENGYFSGVATPNAVRAALRAKSRAPRRIILCPPVGVHDSMAGMIEHRVRDGCLARGIDPRTTAVLIIGHGSARAPGHARALHRHTGRLAAHGIFATVIAACLEEPPFVTDTIRTLRDYTVAVVGFFAGEGGHMRDDVPALIVAEQAARGPARPDVHNFGCVTDSPMMTPIILDHAQAAQDQRRS